MNKVSVLKTFGNISNRQTITFGKADNSYLWHFQNTDNQYRYSHKITPNSTGKEKDPLRLYLQSGELCRARLTSPPDLLTGYSYFGARYLDHALMTSWLSVDPMADKYPSLSPYAYCAWNPLKLVDPNGRDVWKVSEDGHVKKTSNVGGNKKQTIIYANGNIATFRGTKHHTVMSDLEDKKGESNTISSSYGSKNMQFTYAYVFKSMADNTNVEWIMERYSDNHFALGTMHNQTFSPPSFYLSKKIKMTKLLLLLFILTQWQAAT